MGVFVRLKCQVCHKVLEGAALTGEALYMNIRRAGFVFGPQGRSICPTCDRPRTRRKSTRR